jgi:uncharacterized membrane protein YcaP (DUF421 family)
VFALGIPAVHIVIRTALVYLAVYVGLRLTGKRELGQMTVFDLVVIILIANAVQNAMVGPDTSITGGIIAAVVLLAINAVVSRLRLRGRTWGTLLEGTPTVLIQNGQLVQPNLVKEGVEPSQLEMAMREHGVDSINDVKLAVLEVDGSISIVPADAKIMRTRRLVRQFRTH